MAARSQIGLVPSYLGLRPNIEALVASTRFFGIVPRQGGVGYMLTTGYQLAAARALIGMDQVELAEKVGLSANTIRNMEASKAKQIAGRSANVGAVQRALEAAGIEFLNHGQPGVRLKAGSTAQLKPAGPATDAVDAMDNAISRDAQKTRRKD